MVRKPPPQALIQALQALTPQQIDDILANLPPLGISRLTPLIDRLSPGDQFELVKQILFSMKAEYVDELQFWFANEYYLRQDLGELEETPDLVKTKLEIKRIPYKAKKTFYTYVYVLRRRDGVQRCLGALLPVEHDYQYRLPEAGGIVFSQHEQFRLTHKSDPQQVKLIRLLRLDPPPPDYDFEDDQPLNLQVGLHFESLNPFTYQPQSVHQVDFPDCLKTGIFRKKDWHFEAIALPPSAATTFEVGSATASGQFLRVAPQAVPAVLEQIEQWEILSQSALKGDRWHLTISEVAYRLIHGSGTLIVEYRTRDSLLWSEQSVPVLVQWFEELATGASPEAQQIRSRLQAFVQRPSPILSDWLALLFNLHE
jgi:hypothetical protein